MTLTYIFHSGFALETEQSILVFDYWMDPSGMSAARALLACYWRDARTATPLVAVSSSNGSKSGCSFLCTSLQALNPLGA